MAPAGIVEAVAVAGQSLGRLSSRLEDGAPDQFALQRLEERLDHRVVIAVALAGHRDHDAGASYFGLVLVGTILTAAVRMMEEACYWPSHDQGSLQGGQSQF